MPRHPTTPSKRTRALDGLGLPGTEEDCTSSRSAAPGMPFRLPKDFVEAEGREKNPVFGFNGLGELVYKRTYARYLSEDCDDREEWWG